MARVPKMVGEKFPWHAALTAFSICISLAGPASLYYEKYMYTHTRAYTHTRTYTYSTLKVFLEVTQLTN